MKYVVVVLAKNEEHGISITLDSLLKQHILPLKILIVDDGSTDNTAKVINEYILNSHIISYYFNESEKANYSLGGNITRLFFKGKSLLDKIGLDYDYIVKMDADIFFEPDFMSRISNELEKENYGIVSGTPYIIKNKKKQFIISPEWHTNGDFKIYNRKFLELIDDFPQDLGWDCVDNILAIEKNYKTRAFKEINYKQNRPIGRFSIKKGRMRQGLGAYKLGYSSLYLVLKAIHDLIKPPVIIGSAYYLAGYFDGKLKQVPKTINIPQRKLLRKLLWRSLNQRFINGKPPVIQFSKSS